ncbi:MAG: hypothetical protein BGO43_07030 [Gammaproteobacteria bacterium 39-13]|nr:rhodanese-like domain-containing protein [Gammaproteobacteria bacterium]OJV90589.1 MAG: hypothetical protein BGO43_07030 [Gammaproteobacteria bacterium 39-13]
MNPYISFLMEHWMLSTAFVAIAVLLAANEWRHRSMGVTSISPQQLVDFLNHAGGVVVDVRATPRFAQGHILGAINLPQEDFNNRVNTLNKYKSKPVVLVCDTGGVSPKMGQHLKANGFTQLYYLAGGVQAWQSQGLPLVKN